jgi:hypothetical protein
MNQSETIANWNAKLQRVFDNKDGVDVLERIFGMLEWASGNQKAQELWIMICTSCPGAAKEIIDRMSLAAQKRLVEQIEREKGARK